LCRVRERSGVEAGGQGQGGIEPSGDGTERFKRAGVNEDDHAVDWHAVGWEGHDDVVGDVGRWHGNKEEAMG
jgi:hypothetical protein